MDSYYMFLHIVTSFKDTYMPYTFYTRQEQLDIQVEFEAVVVAVSMKRIFWLWRSVVRRESKISEENIASIFRAEE
jgi:hypothetical protein